MNWCFAIINNKLAEIYFERKKGKPKILGYCYVKRDEYKTKHEQEMIDHDIINNQLICRNGVYKRVNVKKEISYKS